MARLERIRTVAIQQKENEVVEKVAKLLEKENARHDKWMSEHVKGGAK